MPRKLTPYEGRQIAAIEAWKAKEPMVVDKTLGSFLGLWLFS